MKKLFLALMAVVVMASCGGSDNGGGSGMSPQQAAQKIMEIETTYNHELIQAMQGNDAELFVKAVEKYEAASKDLKSKVQNLDLNSVAPEVKQDIENISRSNKSNFELALRQFVYELSDQQKERIGIRTN